MNSNPNEELYDFPLKSKNNIESVKYYKIKNDSDKEINNSGKSFDFWQDIQSNLYL